MTDKKSGAHVRVPRYSGSARINHWIVAVSFVLLLVSGLSLFHPSLYPLTVLFGGGAVVRWLHPILGLVLAVAFLGLFFDPALEPMADDVATLGLDMLLAEEGWKRGGHNPLLLGY